MNIFYKIKPAVDTKETGSAYPAVVSYDDYKFKSLNSIHNLKTNIKPNFNPELRFKLANHANLTDMLSEAASNSAGLLVSSRLLDVFNKHKITPCIIYSVPISASESIVEYFWIHFTWEEWYKFVNWKNSTFRVFENGAFSTIELDSHEEYLFEVSKSEYFRIAPDSVTLLPIPYDMYCHPFEGEIKVSNILAEDLLNSKISGIEIIPKPQILIS